MDNIKFFGNTDMGRLRKNNEDAYIVQNVWDENHVLAVAIDGVGGYDGGEVAAGLAKKHIAEYLGNYHNGERIELLKQAVIYANNNIFSARKNLPQYSSMSCVLTAILVDVEEMCVNMVHVGDTRLYQYADDELVKLSHDHSLVGYREEIGELTEDEAMHHPQRNVIGRDVGSTFLDGNVEDYIETATFTLRPKSSLLLCSDGLCDMLKSVQIKAVLEQRSSVEEKVNSLIDAANEAGGRDNVTVVLIDVDIHVADNSGAEECSLSDTPGIIEDSENCRADEVNIPARLDTWMLKAIFAIGIFIIGCLSGIYAERNGLLYHRPEKTIVVERPEDNSGPEVIKSSEQSDSVSRQLENSGNYVTCPIPE